ncbi:hypothetical protein C9374_005247 [Naegleria lovaniensis]|uniref:AAA+ ATPase domain-containing protein n=1 Tax=Naegleria lovaniensis TaxID=51637 RepID=A0AA88KIX0_NAELO|nr:uncharacterized protein C9374_005247 [Naegleria lovaniensis]KAG2382667.1 hypothetical protein C9374_005247 [Naegleria lovaniensis]
MGKNKNRSRPFTNHGGTLSTSSQQQQSGKKASSNPKGGSKFHPKVDVSLLVDRVEEYMESHDKTSINYNSSEELMPVVTYLRKSYEKEYKSIPLLEFKDICAGAIEKMFGDDSDMTSSSSEDENAMIDEATRVKNLTKLKDMIKNEKNSMNQQLQNVYKEQQTTITPSTNSSSHAGEASSQASSNTSSEDSLKRKRSTSQVNEPQTQENKSTTPNHSNQETNGTTTNSNNNSTVAPPNKKTKPSSGQPSDKEKRTKIIVETPNIRFSDLGGIDNILQDIRELIEYPILHPEIYTSLGVDPPRGILLHGPPGSGKTMLANAIAGELQIPFLKVSAPEIVSGMSGESEAKIRHLFRDAVANAPSIVFIDEIDAILSKRDNASKEMEKRIVAQLLTCMDDLTLDKTNGKAVIVIGATNRPDSLDNALRRAGRFDREISLGIPDEKARMQILKILTRKLKLEGGHEVFDFQNIAHNTPGYVGADLKALVNESAVVAIHRIFGNIVFGNETKEATPKTLTPEEEVKRRSIISETLRNMKEPLSEEQLASLSITFEDFEKAIKRVQPSAKREGFATVPNVTWDDIGALEEVRDELRLTIMEPIKRPEKYKKVGLDVPAGVLLYGPPGCGKTLLAKAISNDSGANFISIKGPELLNKYVGESERAVRQVFSRAAASSPCVIFFDEMDALCPKRDNESSSQSSERVVNQLLTEMDGLESRGNVFVIAATNRPDMIDPAMLRPGRLDKLLYVKLPNEKERIQVLQTIARKTPMSPNVNLDEIAKLCENFSGADLSALVREAATCCLKESIQNNTDNLIVTREHFKVALRKVHPSVSEKDLKIYDKIANSLRTSRNHIVMDDEPKKNPHSTSSK